MTSYEYFTKTIDVIESCKTEVQIETAARWVYLLLKKLRKYQGHDVEFYVVEKIDKHFRTNLTTTTRSEYDIRKAIKKSVRI